MRPGVRDDRGVPDDVDGAVEIEAKRPLAQRLRTGVGKGDLAVESVAPVRSGLILEGRLSLERRGVRNPHPQHHRYPSRSRSNGAKTQQKSPFCGKVHNYPIPAFARAI